MNKAELTKEFGADIEKVEGFADFLASQSSGVVDVKVDVAKRVGAFVLDKHWWSGSSGIGMASIVGVYRDGEVETERYDYRDQYSASRDNWANDFGKIEIVEVTPESVQVKVTPLRKEYSAQRTTLRIKAKIQPKKKSVRTGQAGKEAFEKRIQEEMEKCVQTHLHHHPLFTRQTHICDSKIDSDRQVAAWILFEQIDTDRCTPEGSGWLGDQYRYSLWVVDGKQEPRQVTEDHAYSKDRGCDIRGLRIFNGKVYATNWKGEERDFAV